MTELIQLVESAATGPAQMLIAGAWQGLLLASAAWLAMQVGPGIAARISPRLAPKISPRVRFLLWMVVFLLAATLPFSAWMHSSKGAAGVALASVKTMAAPIPQISAAWAVVLAVAWALASLFFLGQLLLNALRLHALAKHSTKMPVTDSGLRLLLDGAKRRAFHPIELRLSQNLESPVAIGFFHPAIVIPQWLARTLTPVELSHIVMHELAHLERRDDWTNLLQKLLRALFPLNPALFWADRQLCREREMACDDAVLDRSIGAREYASCLTALAEKRLLRRDQALAPAAWRRRSELADRVHRILQRKSSFHPFSSRLLVAVSLGAFLSTGYAVAHCPRMIAFLPPPARRLGSASPQKQPAVAARLAQAALAAAQPARLERVAAPALPHTNEDKPAGRAGKASRVRSAEPSRSLRANSNVSRRSGSRAATAPTRRERLMHADATDSTPPVAARTQIVLTMWVAPPAPALVNGSLFAPQFVAFQARSGWIVIQL